MTLSEKQKAAQLKPNAIIAWNVLKDKAAFDALTTAQKAELLRRAQVFLLKRELKDEIED